MTTTAPPPATDGTFEQNPLAHLSEQQLADIYAYLLGTVAPDGTITFQVRQINESDVPASVVKEFSDEQAKWCFEQNKSNYKPTNPVCNTSSADSE